MLKFNRWYRRVFFEPNTGGNTSGGTGGDNQPTDDQQDGTFVSPFASVDKALLDDTIRQSIEKAEADMQKLHKEAQTGRQFQSRYDQTQAQLAQTQEALQRLQNPNNQQQQPAAQTFEQELTQKYVDSGYDLAMAKNIAKVNVPIMLMVQSRATEDAVNKMSQSLGPLANNVVSNNAEKAFQEAFANDSVGMFTNEIREQTWKTVQDVAAKGTLIQPDFVQNLAYINYCRGIQNGTIKPNQNQPAPVIQQQQQSSRFSFPGAGNLASTPPVQRSEGGNFVDADTQAAIAATTGGWPVQPKAFKGAADPNKIRITRGGV